MQHCHICEKDVTPVMDMTGTGKIVAQCPICQGVFGRAEDMVSTPIGTTPEGASVSIDRHDDHANERQRIQLEQRAPVGGKRIEASTGITDQAKARIVVIDKELERLGGLQRERRRLFAMVAAAEAEDAADAAAALPHAAE